MSGAQREGYKYEMTHKDQKVNMIDEPEEVVRFYGLNVGTISGEFAKAGFGFSGMAKEEVIKLRDELNRALEE